MRVRILIRWIGRALFVLSLFILLFWRFSSHRWLAGVASPMFLKLFLLVCVLAGLGEVAIWVDGEMETQERSPRKRRRMM